MSTKVLKEKLAVTGDKAMETATAAIDAAAEAARTAKGITSDAGTHLSETAETVRAAADEGISAARETLAHAGARLSSTLGAEAKAAGDASARVLHGLSDGVDAVADRLRGRTAGDILADLRDIARRNPGTFAIGAALAGFAVARLLKTSANRHSADALGLGRHRGSRG